jgi:hypothetical protein
MISGDPMLKYLKGLDKEGLVREGYRFKMYENLLIVPFAPSMSQEEESVAIDVLLEKVKAGRMNRAQYESIFSTFTGIQDHIRSLGLDDLPDYDWIIQEFQNILAVYTGQARL